MNNKAFTSKIQVSKSFSMHSSSFAEVGNVHIANVVAPAIFGERAILQPGSFSAAKVRSCTVAECMILPPTSAAVPIIRARLPEDIGRLERMLEKKMALTRTQLASTEDLTKAADQQDKGLFGACSAAFLAKLGNYFERRVYMPEQKIILEGEEPRYGVMIHQGTAVVESQGVVLAECGPGEFLGEVAILGLAKTSSATVRASTKIVAYTVEARLLLGSFEEGPLFSCEAFFHGFSSFFCCFLEVFMRFRPMSSTLRRLKGSFAGLRPRRGRRIPCRRCSTSSRRSACGCGRSWRSARWRTSRWR